MSKLFDTIKIVEKVFFLVSDKENQDGFAIFCCKFSLFCFDELLFDRLLGHVQRQRSLTCF